MTKLTAKSEKSSVPQTRPATGGALAEEQARALLPKLVALEKVRNELGAENISVPGIVVAGSQSAGKSSVLESLSGVNLPRGETIETRVPLFMRLSSDASCQASFAEIATSPDMGKDYVKLDDLDRVAEEIRRLTVQLAGSGGHVRDAPIYLNVVHPHGPTMTLIDLPGITHISEDGQGDIHDETVGLVSKYIQPEEMIILAVAPATEDLHNAEAISRAQKVDPAGKRSLGVITKCDMATRDTGLVGKLVAEERKHVRLALGMIGVRNRTQTEVDQGISPAEVRRREAQFFETSEVTRGVPRRCWGMHTLTDRIVKLQMATVNHWMQGIQVRLRKDIAEARRVLAALLEAIETPEAQRLLLSAGVQHVISALQTAAEGRSSESRPELHVCAHAAESYERYAAALRAASPDFLGAEMFKKAQAHIAATRGAALSNFLSPAVFKNLVLGAYRGPLREAGSELVAELREYIEGFLKTHLSREQFKDFPILLEALEAELSEYLDAAQQRAAASVEALNDAQEFIFSQNSAYTATLNKLRALVNDRQKFKKQTAPSSTDPNDPAVISYKKSAADWDKKLAEAGLSVTVLDGILGGSSNENQAAFDMQVSLHAYSKLILDCMLDMVPKLSQRNLIDKIQKREVALRRRPLWSTQVSENLFAHMNKAFPAERLSACVVEDANVAAERGLARTRLERLESSLEILKALSSA